MVKIYCPKCQEKKVIQIGQWKETMLSMPLWLFTSSATSVPNTRSMERDHHVVPVRAEQPKYYIELQSNENEFYVLLPWYEDRWQRTFRITSPEQLKWMKPIWEASGETSAKSLEMREQNEGEAEVTGFRNPLSQRHRLGWGCEWRWSRDTATPHNPTGISGIGRLFWYLEGIHRYCISRICS